MIHSSKAVKSSDEISKIESACKLGDKTFSYILKKIHLGITEKEVAQEINSFIKKNGAKPSFPTIVAFGKNSTNIHNIPTNNKLTKNQIILLDFGVKINGYCSDMTRTIFSGKPTHKQKHMYETVLNAQQKAIDFIAKHSNDMYHYSGNKKIVKILKAKSVDNVARLYIKSKGYPSIPHSLGHGIGKKVHEAFRISPKSKIYLKEGMVFSVEPGIYLSGFGGVRIEDLVVLKKTGPRLLTHSPKNIIVL